MQQLKELFKNDLKQASKYCEEEMILKGFIYNPSYGWEKPEVLKSFGLEPNMVGVPGELYEDFDLKVMSSERRDAFGKKTGEKETQTMKVPNGKKFWSASQNWIMYKAHKKAEHNQWLAEKYGKEAIMGI